MFSEHRYKSIAIALAIILNLILTLAMDPSASASAAKAKLIVGTKHVLPFDGLKAVAAGERDAMVYDAPIL